MFGFNPWVDQLDDINQIVSESGENEATVLRKLVDEALQKNLSELKGLPVKELVASRYDKFRKMAQFFTEQ